RNHYHRSERPDHTDNVCEDLLAIPLLESLSPRLAEAKVKRAREELLRAVQSPRREQLFGPDDTERFVYLGAYDVLTAVASRKRQISGARLPASRQVRKQPAVFVVRMCAGVKDTRNDAELPNRLSESKRASVFSDSAVRARDRNRFE